MENVMPGRGFRSRAAIQLEKALEEFDRVLLMDEKRMGRHFADLFAGIEGFQEIEKRTLILSTMRNREDGNMVWRQVTERELEEMLQLYFLYECSNRISVVSSRCCFGSLFDFVETGILTEKEALMAFLG